MPVRRTGITHAGQEIGEYNGLYDSSLKQKAQDGRIFFCDLSCADVTNEKRTLRLRYSLLDPRPCSVSFFAEKTVLKQPLSSHHRSSSPAKPGGAPSASKASPSFLPASAASSLPSLALIPTRIPAGGRRRSCGTYTGTSTATPSARARIATAVKYRSCRASSDSSSSSPASSASESGLEGAAVSEDGAGCGAARRKMMGEFGTSPERMTEGGRAGVSALANAVTLSRSRFIRSEPSVAMISVAVTAAVTRNGGCDAEKQYPTPESRW
mmetsp:Transcript_8583/g.21342  ORF Transcript_8583/g.21342 Transcript_8583/m.21342 type:complete len:268 (-) Transcript_8583:587-1390(-)